MLRLLPIAIPNLAESKDLKDSDDFRRFSLNSLLIGYLKRNKEYEAELVLPSSECCPEFGLIQRFEGK